MLALLKIDLGIRTTVYDSALEGYLTSAAEKIKAEGASDLDASSSVVDARLVIDYAAFKWRSREAGGAMPRSLRWELNNRIFGTKARTV